VFARQIRICAFSEGKQTRWQPKPVPGVPGCLSGQLLPLLRLPAAEPVVRALLLRSGPGEFLFALKSRGFARFEAALPTIWVTAPTEENLDLGFLINGRFALDVGRAQLARDPAQNEDIGRHIGREFGARLGELCRAFEAPTSRQSLSVALGLAADTSPYDLWDSLWDLLVQSVRERADRDEPAERLVRHILWGSTDSGAAGYGTAARLVVMTQIMMTQIMSQLMSERKALLSLTVVRIEEDEPAAASGEQTGTQGAVPLSGKGGDALVTQPSGHTLYTQTGEQFHR
jgi:hypothetical protein